MNGTGGSPLNPMYGSLIEFKPLRSSVVASAKSRADAEAGASIGKIFVDCSCNAVAVVVEIGADAARTIISARVSSKAFTIRLGSVSRFLASAIATAARTNERRSR